MSESQEKLFLHWSDSIQKFDYYITGLVGASVVYLIKEHQATQLGLNSSTIELIAIIALIVSLFAGITRLERIVAILRVTHDLIPKEAFLKKLASRKPGQQILSEATFKVLSEEEVIAKEAHLSKVVRKATDGRVEHGRISSISYSVRNIALAIGLLLLLFAKASEPYLQR